MSDEPKNESLVNPGWFTTLDNWIGRIREDLELAMTALIEKSVKLRVEPCTIYDENQVDILFQNGPVVITARFSLRDIGAWHILLPRPLAATIAELSVSGDAAIPFDEATHSETLREIWGQIIASLEMEMSALTGGELTTDMPDVSVDPTLAMARLDSSPVLKLYVEIEDMDEQEFLIIFDPEFSVLFGVDQAPGVGDALLSSDELPVGGSEDKIREDDLAKELEMLGFGDEEETKVSTTTVKKPVFEDFGEPQRSGAPSGDKPRNLDILLDINLPIVIELGRTTMLVKDILELGPGSVIELDKLSGEPVDLYVNDKKFARGEVVVIEENFGVRITELIKLDERIKILG